MIPTSLYRVADINRYGNRGSESFSDLLCLTGFKLEFRSAIHLSLTHYGGSCKQWIKTDMVLVPLSIHLDGQTDLGPAPYTMRLPCSSMYHGARCGEMGHSGNNNNGWYLLNTYYMSSAVLSTFPSFCLDAIIPVSQSKQGLKAVDRPDISYTVSLMPRAVSPMVSVGGEGRWDWVVLA